MATYKLIQDIEAEDHILGPLSLRQFIFALIAAFCFYMVFIGVSKHLLPLAIIFAIPGLFCAFFAFPFGRDQPTEIWALAKIRFWFKPRRRVWDQVGMKELVTITAPKKIEIRRTDGLSQGEVKSRLSALATTLDSRGWAVKNVALNDSTGPDVRTSSQSDRLVSVDNMPQPVPQDDFRASDDIMDAVSNPLAQQFNEMIDTSTQNHRQNIIDEMNGIRAAEAQQPSNQGSNWFVNRAAGLSQNPVQAQPNSISLPQPEGPGSDAALAAQLEAQAIAQNSATANLSTLQPQPAAAAPPTTVAPPSTTPSDPAILSLANRDDLNVATLKREADRANGGDNPNNEVVVSLR